MSLHQAQAFAVAYKELFTVGFGLIATAALPFGAYVSIRSGLSELRALSLGLNNKIDTLSSTLQANQNRNDQERREIRGEIAGVRGENREDNREMRSYLRSTPAPKR